LLSAYAACNCTATSFNARGLALRSGRDQLYELLYIQTKSDTGEFQCRPRAATVPDAADAE
jgi:hypothetical protein